MSFFLDLLLETLEVNGVLYDMNGDVIPQEYQDKWVPLYNAKYNGENNNVWHIRI